MKETLFALSNILAIATGAVSSLRSGLHEPVGLERRSEYEAAADTWALEKFTSLVGFGDSYKDDSRLASFVYNNNTAPPVGWVNPANYESASGRRSWPQYVAQYTGANVYNYAVIGAVCSNDITPRWFAYTNAPFPAVKEYEIPAYIADSQHVNQNGTKFMMNPQNETVYSIFIGTNDLGNYAFISDAQVLGTTIVDYIECVFDAIQSVYDNGGRYFVLQNVALLHLAPQYGLPGKGGLATTKNWPDKPDNITEISFKMLEYVLMVNKIYEYQTPYLVKIAKRFPGVNIAVMDINGLLTDIYDKPSEYLNGTSTLNVTGYSDSAETSHLDPDSFMWYDVLHPSEQVQRVIACEFVNVVGGSSKWATYWSG
ncbi:hypothetical protein ACET3X_002077 [Alternaria dauci]|uniref:GDSL lipase/acylhydrolase family protein n=1 Tax=Alternaria dauci TaxID=48095 RepID=A0ABR3UZ65_9PLEO